MRVALAMYTRSLALPRHARLREEGSPITAAFSALSKSAHIPSPLGTMTAKKRRLNGQKGAASRLAEAFVRRIL